MATAALADGVEDLLAAIHCAASAGLRVAVVVLRVSRPAVEEAEHVRIERLAGLLASESRVHFAAGWRLADEGRSNLDRDPLGAALPNPLLEVAGRACGLALLAASRPGALELAVLSGDEQSSVLQFPALALLDAGEARWATSWSKPLLTVISFSVSGWTRLTARWRWQFAFIAAARNE